MLSVPRSMARDKPPVCRSRWKRSDRSCRCFNTLTEMSRRARSCTLAKIMSRISVVAEEATRTSPYPMISTMGTTSTALGRVVSESITDL